jgi:molybdopterin molybdotransferase
VNGTLLNLEEAQATVLAGIEPLPEVDQVLPIDALGRVLARDVVAGTALPPWARSAMDGFAIRASDTASASEGSPVRLTVVGEVRAGHVPAVRVLGSTAVRIATGAPLPPGSDAVVPIEHTTPLDEDGHPGLRGRDATGRLPAGCLVHGAVRPGNAVHEPGHDVRPGMVLAQAGDPVTAAVVALASAAGLSLVSLRRRPVAAVLSVGDDLRAQGQPLGPAGVPDSGGSGLRALVRQAGAVLLDLGIVGDRLEDVTAALRGGIAGADLVVVSGGVSGRPDDIVRLAFDMVGHANPWRVAIQPGRPFAFGRAEADGRTSAVPLFGLPGNPVASFQTFDLFVEPVLRRLAGRTAPYRPHDLAVLEERVQKRAGSRGFQRVTVVREEDGTPSRDDEGRVLVRLAGGQGRDVVAALATADAVVVIPEALEDVESGTSLDLRWLPRA